MILRATPLEALDPGLYRELVRRALAEDLGWDDVTTEATVDPALRARGILLAKSPLVLAGLDVALETFRQLDPAVKVTVHVHDGDRAEPGTVIAELVGCAATFVTAERTALNFLQRMSGSATLTRRFVDAAGGRIVILDTRKTTPTLRTLEKYAVRCGGGVNHRQGLDDMVLIKDNHIRLAGGVTRAMERARRFARERDLLVEVEAQNLRQVDEALAAGAEMIMLDNLSTGEIRDAVRRVGGRAKIEISGGVTLDRIGELASTGADYVSVGALTHSAPAADISFELEPV